MEAPFQALPIGSGLPPGEYPNWHFDVVGHGLHGPAGSCHLTPREAAVMACLVDAAPGRPVSRADLLNRVWADTEVGDEALSVVISRLRRHLRRAGVGGTVIRTVPKTGYVLTQAVPPDVRPAPVAPEIIPRVPARRMAGLAIVMACASLLLALAMSLAHLFSGHGLQAAPATAEERPPPAPPEPDPGSWRH